MTDSAPMTATVMTGQTCWNAVSPNGPTATFRLSKRFCFRVCRTGQDHSRPLPEQDNPLGVYASSTLASRVVNRGGSD